MCDCKIDAQSIKRFQQSLGGAKIRLLDISDNPTLDLEAFETLGLIVKHCEVEEIRLWDCNIDAQRIKRFHKSLDGAKIRILDIGRPSYFDGKMATSDEISALSEFLPHVIEKICLETWEINTKLQRILVKSLNQLSEKGLKVIFGSWNNPSILTAAQKAWSAYHIGENGREIELPDCTVIFPNRAFESPTSVWISVGSYRSNLPEDYIPITPTLNIESELPLLTPVEIRFKSWCVKDPNQDDVMVYILHQKKPGLKWDVYHEFPLSDERVVTFKCQNFSPILGALRDILLGRTKWIIAPFLQIEFREFISIFVLDNDNDKSEIKNDFKGLKRKTLSPMSCKIGCKIISILKCSETQRYSFDPKEGHSFLIDQDFVDRKRKICTHSLDDSESSQSPTSVKVQCEIYQTVNDVMQLDQRHPFWHEWRIPETMAPVISSQEMSRGNTLRISIPSATGVSHNISNTTINKTEYTGTKVSGGEVKVHKEGCSDVVGVSHQTKDPQRQAVPSTSGAHGTDSESNSPISGRALGSDKEDELDGKKKK